MRKTKMIMYNLDLVLRIKITNLIPSKMILPIYSQIKVQLVYLNKRVTLQVKLKMNKIKKQIKINRLILKIFTTKVNFAHKYNQSTNKTKCNVSKKI